MTTENKDLPPLKAWHARSFWQVLAGAVLSIAAASGFDLLGFFGIESETALVDAIMQVVGIVLMVLAWRERRAPHYRLTITEEGK